MKPKWIQQLPAGRLRDPCEPVSHMCHIMTLATSATPSAIDGSNMQVHATMLQAFRPCLSPCGRKHDCSQRFAELGPTGTERAILVNNVSVKSQIGPVEKGRSALCCRTAVLTRAESMLEPSCMCSHIRHSYRGPDIKSDPSS